jgi:hypothetical protein
MRVVFSSKMEGYPVNGRLLELVFAADALQRRESYPVSGRLLLFVVSVEYEIGGKTTQ